MNNEQKTLGFVLMMDVSPSIEDAIGMVIIDAKAFVREARAGDQFGVNRFSTVADWVYPAGTNPGIVTVTSGLSEIQAATDKMEHVFPHQGCTNIGAAVSLANTMISQAATDRKAFVLISDGQHNTGKHPSKVLGNEPPIYVAGLGQYMHEEYFKSLIAKNPNSRFYDSPDAIDMSLIFNTILADANKANLALNRRDTYQRSGGEYFKHEFLLSDKEGRVNLGVVWSDKRCFYTQNAPGGFGINLVLRDPEGNKVSVEPKFSDDGSCIIHLDDPMPGRWTLLTQHAIPQVNVYGTTGVIDLDSTISSELSVPNVVKRGEPLDVSLLLRSDARDVIERASVDAQVTMPTISVENALDKYENEWKSVSVPDEVNEDPRARLGILRAKKRAMGVDIMPETKQNMELAESKDGCYHNSLLQTQTPGIYDVELKIEGINPKTGFPFTRLERRSLIVE